MGRVFTWETRVQSWVKSYQRLKKMVLDAALLNTQHHKVCTKGKVEQSKDRSCAPPHLGVMKREPPGRLRSPTLLYIINIIGRVFANGPGDLGSIPVRVIPKTLKMVLDTSLLNTQQYKVRIKGKVEQSWEKSSALSYTSV